MIINPYWFVPINTCDADAQTFNTNAGITGTTEQSAVCQLVSDLKTYNIWTKMKAIYPFVGGTATTHKYNLKNPLDTNAAFRLVFSGGSSHSNGGVTFNGVNGYGNTFLSASLVLTTNSNHMSIYSRTSTTRTDSFAGEIGQGPDTSGNGALVMVIRRNNTPNCYYLYTSASNIITTTNNDGSGYYIGTTRSTTDRKYFKNLTTLGTSTSVLNQSLTNFNFWIGAMNLGNAIFAPANFECAFATIGDGLTDTEANNLYTAVQAFQTTLGRQV